MRRRFHLILLAALVVAPRAHADDWPQWRGANRDGQWNEPNALKMFAAKEAEITWRMPIGSGYSGPTVAEGNVYLMDRVVEPEQIERVLCFDEKTGKEKWKIEYACPYVDVGYEAGPRASVSIDGDRAYALGTMGHLHCLNAQDGKEIWKRDLNHDYKIQTKDRKTTRMPIWGISASPLIYKDLAILHIGGRDGACVVAVDKMSGEEKWRALDDRAQYSSPVIVKQAGKDVVVVWTGDSISGIDPQDGNVHWSIPMKPRNMPIGIATPIVQGNRIFVSSFYDGALMLEFADDAMTAETVWRKIGRDEKDTDGLHSIISTPIWLKNHLYGVDSYGELRCLEADTGKRVWEDLSATPKVRWGTIHFVQNGEHTWMQNERGDLIIAKLTPEGYDEISRTKLLEPTLEQLRRRNGVCWSHPAYANGFVFSRNDKEIVCAKVTK